MYHECYCYYIVFYHVSCLSWNSRAGRVLPSTLMPGYRTWVANVSSRTEGVWTNIQDTASLSKVHPGKLGFIIRIRVGTKLCLI